MTGWGHQGGSGTPQVPEAAVGQGGTGQELPNWGCVSGTEPS